MNKPALLLILFFTVVFHFVTSVSAADADRKLYEKRDFSQNGRGEDALNPKEREILLNLRTRPDQIKDITMVSSINKAALRKNIIVVYTPNGAEHEYTGIQSIDTENGIHLWHGTSGTGGHFSFAHNGDGKDLTGSFHEFGKNYRIRKFGDGNKYIIMEIVRPN